MPTPTPSPSPTASPTPTPDPNCTVPNLIGTDTKFADKAWGTTGQGAGFVQNLIFNPQVGNKNDYTIGHQSQTAGSNLPCATTVMTVSP